MRGSFYVDMRAVVLGGAAVWTSVGSRANVIGRHIETETYRRAALVDGECPVEAGHVPVEFVIFLEKPEHARRAIAELVGVLTVIDVAVAAPEIGSDAVLVAGRVEIFARAVAQHG